MQRRQERLWGLVTVGVMTASVMLSACSGDDESAGGSGGASAGSGGTSSGGNSSGGNSSGGAGGSVGPAPEVTKFDILGSAPGSTLSDTLCAAHQKSPGCDLCDALGFYGDLECDSALVDAGLCKKADPDCTPQTADYYVAPGGNDSGDGSEGSPFATVQKAHDVAKPGDLIYLRGGTYKPTAKTVFKAEGTAAQPIILRSYPGETPIIDASQLPEGDTQGGSTPTWQFAGAKYWQIRGPLQLTNGRGTGVSIEKDTQNLDLVFIDSSYNGKSAARAGHGFLIVEKQWATAKNIRFINCDAHHNANHRTKSGENVAENLYQHGDGFRIKSGVGIELIGCRAWHNMDDNYDLVWADSPVSLYQCWSGFAGRDDAQGTLTGTPGFEAAWGEGIKLGYTKDTGQHSALRCLSWKNVHLGFRMDGGPYRLENCASYANGRRALGWDLGPNNVLHNCVDLDTPKASGIPGTTTTSHNSWDSSSAFSVAADDFEDLDDAALLSPRSPDGSLPVVNFMRLVPGSDLVDAGTKGNAPFQGAAPDVGCFERQ